LTQHGRKRHDEGASHRAHHGCCTNRTQLPSPALLPLHACSLCMNRTAMRTRISTRQLTGTVAFALCLCCACLSSACGGAANAICGDDPDSPIGWTRFLEAYHAKSRAARQIHLLLIPTTSLCLMHTVHTLPSNLACSDGDGEVVGAVQLINKLHPKTKERESFDRGDLNKCKAISLQIGLALMNIRHREQIEIYSDLLAKQMSAS